MFHPSTPHATSVNSCVLHYLFNLFRGLDASKPEEMEDDVTLLQAEVQRLSMEENRLDESIRCIGFFTSSDMQIS